MHVISVDLKQAYDNVPIKKLWDNLERSGVSYTIIIIRKLYEGSTPKIKLGNR